MQVSGQLHAPATLLKIPTVYTLYRHPLGNEIQFHSHLAHSPVTTPSMLNDNDS